MKPPEDFVHDGCTHVALEEISCLVTLAPPCRGCEQASISGGLLFCLSTGHLRNVGSLAMWVM